MIDFLAKSKTVADKRKMEFIKLNFFVCNSGNRLQRVKSGCRLFQVLEDQGSENKEYLDIIDRFLRKKEEALKLEKEKKDKYAKKLKIQNPSKRISKDDFSENYQSKDISEYYNESGFDPKKEVKKEKNLDAFFKKKYEALCQCLGEEQLDKFLKEKIFPSEIPRKKDYKDSIKLSKNQDQTVSHAVKPSFQRHLEFLENQISEAVEVEFKERKRREEEDLKEHEENVKKKQVQLGITPSTTAKLKKNKFREIVKSKFEEASKDQAQIFPDEEEGLSSSFIRKVNNLYYMKKPKTSNVPNKQIINDLLDVGRLDFLKTSHLKAGSPALPRTASASRFPSRYQAIESESKPIPEKGELLKMYYTQQVEFGKNEKGAEDEKDEEDEEEEDDEDEGLPVDAINKFNSNIIKYKINENEQDFTPDGKPLFRASRQDFHPRSSSTSKMTINDFQNHKEFKQSINEGIFNQKNFGLKRSDTHHSLHSNTSHTSQNIVIQPGLSVNYNPKIFKSTAALLQNKKEAMGQRGAQLQNQNIKNQIRNRNFGIRIRKIERQKKPVTNEERKDENLIITSTPLKHHHPHEYNPMGVYFESKPSRQMGGNYTPEVMPMYNNPQLLYMTPSLSTTDFSKTGSKASLLKNISSRFLNFNSVWQSTAYSQGKGHITSFKTIKKNP